MVCDLFMFLWLYIIDFIASTIQTGPLVFPAGNATIDLEKAKLIKSRGISWSMPPDYLRYYGRSGFSHISD